MIHARGLLDRVRAVAPTEADRRRLDKAFARKTGRKPRTLDRALARAEERGEVSAKVADNVHAFLGAHDRCERCGRWYPCEGRNARCCVCRKVDT
jgi:hypothetical protein